MEQAIGLPAMADHYRKIATEMRKTIRPKYWDAARNLFADTQDHRGYSQHVNALAILTGVTKGGGRKGDEPNLSGYELDPVYDLFPLLLESSVESFRFRGSVLG